MELDSKPAYYNSGVTFNQTFSPDPGCPQPTFISSQIVKVHNVTDVDMRQESEFPGTNRTSPHSLVTQLSHTSRIEDSKEDVQERQDHKTRLPILPTSHEWSTNSPAFAEVMVLADHIQYLIDPQATSLVYGNSLANLNGWIQEARLVLGENIIYSDEFVRSLNLSDFKKEEYEHNDKMLRTPGITLDALISSKTKIHKLKGQPEKELIKTLKDISTRWRVIDILKYGQRKFMKEGFSPNGGAEVSIGGSYRKMRDICNNAVYKLYEKGQVLIFTKDALAQTGNLKDLHISKLVWTQDPSKVEGRTCLNASHSSKNFPSYNESIDYSKSDPVYPMPALPMLPDLAELACQQREAYPSEPLAGATVDVSSAYNQCPVTTDLSKLTAAQVRVPNGLGGWVVLVVIYLVCIFGCATAGNVYCQCAVAIDELHNARHAKRRSHTYIDDGMIIEPLRLIRISTDEYIAHVETLFGKGSVNAKKVKVWENELEGIGWHFDFQTWTVQPKQKGMAKMLLCLFNDIGPNDTSISEDTLDKLTGLLTWYSDGLPYGSKFISSFYALKHHLNPHSKRMRITAEAALDLSWWRALLMIAYSRPRLIAASISSVRRVLIPTLFMRTDASSLVGGGAYMSHTRGGNIMGEFNVTPIRWTRAEAEMFITMNVSINVLEYFVVVYYVMWWGPLLRNKIIYVECDNTSAVSWIMRNRAKNNSAAETLAKIFSLFCLTYNITIICTHICGDDNTIADDLSRNLSLASQEMDESLEEETGILSVEWKRRVTLRRLLRSCVLEQSQKLGSSILRRLIELHGSHGEYHARY